MKKITLLGFCSLILIPAYTQLTPYEQGNYNTTATYPQVINYYKKLANASKLVTIQAIGSTDANLPLHLITVSSNAQHNPNVWHAQKRTVILINNGIHPGEPDGIDATMMLVRDIVNKKLLLPNNVALAIIPVYNIGGCLNRSAYFRVDQNGPAEFGFRGNSQNLDLNRDFIKCDSREAKTFAQIYHYINPEIFIDNHVSNGANYQHIMTLLATQHNKLGGVQDAFLQNTLMPALYNNMAQKKYELVPYVNFYGETPEQGWTEFYDSPRYSSGYTTLWHTYGFVPETHMLKNYKQRVTATYELMKSFINIANTLNQKILTTRQAAIAGSITADSTVLDWRHDKTQQTQITFKGYESSKKISDLSGLLRLYYDTTKPFTKSIPFYNTYVPSAVVKKATAYIIPQGWHKVIELLQLNKVNMYKLLKDTIIQVQAYTITDYKSSDKPYEGHHANTAVKVVSNLVSMAFAAGDYFIPLNQVANRYLQETLEPQGRDSYFAWNYFDTILGQKEGYSDYAFEELATAILKDDLPLKSKYDTKKLSDKKFAADSAAQLEYIYKNSKYFEPAYMQYPVYRVL